MKKGSHHSEEAKLKNKLKHIGKRPSPLTEFSSLRQFLSIADRKRIAIKQGFGKWMKGRKLPIEVRKKMRESQIQRVKEGRHNNYKGGLTPINKIIRESLEYRLWRESVFQRDDYTCIWCGQRGGRLEADHIKPFAYFPELRFAIDNGRTLCRECHKKTDTYLYRTIKPKKRKK